MKRIATIWMLMAFTVMATTVKANYEERKTDTFTGVSVRLDATVYIEQGEKNKVEITAQPEALEKMVTEVKNGLLIIRYVRTNMLSNWVPGPVSIRITMPHISQLSLASSGKLFCEKPIESESVELGVSGSGDMLIHSLKSKSVKVGISGSGNIKIAEKSNTKDLAVTITGSGHFIGAELETDRADIRIAGSGDCSLTAHESLKARILGSGDIRYRGNPGVESSVAGSGAVRKVD
jgi:hypothetical protein